AGRATRCAAALKAHVGYRMRGAPRARAVGGDERGLKLDWLAAKPGDGRIAAYRLLRDGAALGQTSRREWTLSVAPNRSYRFSVVAVDSHGRASAASNSVTIAVGHKPPSAPGGLQALPVSESAIGAQWQPSGVAAGRVVGYRVLRDGVVVRQVSATSDVVDNLAPSTDYGISVVAVDNLGYASAASPVVTARTDAPVPTNGHAQAYLLSTTDASFDDFRAHYRQIGVVYPTYYDCTSTLALSGHDDPLWTQWAQARRVLVLPRVNCQSTTRIHALLTDPTLRASWLDQLAAIGADDGYDGVSIDFETGAASDRDALSSFVEELAGRLHRAGKLLTIAVSPKARDSLTHPRSGIFDYPRLSQAADWVLVMAWGLHWSTSAPGAQDDATWARGVADYVATLPTRHRFVYGTNLYAMDWPGGGGTAHPGTAYEYGDIVPRLPALGATIALDPASDNLYATYTDVNGVGHDVWYPDATTTGRRIQMAASDGFGGVAFWRLGLEDQRLWDDPLIAPGASW
ncbi:MAG TPA: glycosyl hydrolase family 18 protein, partial [Conexibacter sp.]|nr:glycosyl hydrolase family 18 protein [Conexibacter sp.]